MEAAQHSSHVPSFPSKLRWRPYSNGSSLKSKKAKKEEQQQQKNQHSTAAQDVNAKAVAHRIRAKTPHRSPVEVQLQWEEAETIESMSHGGHPHSQHPSRQSPSQRNRDSSSQNTTPSSTPPQQKSPQLPEVALVDSETDMGQYKATLPALTGDDLFPLSSIASAKTCQLALNALLENHRASQRLAAQPALALTSVPTPLSMIGPPVSLADTTLNPTALVMNTGYNNSSNTQRRKLSTTALLGMASTSELIESCYYSDTDVSNGYSTAASTLTSPATTHHSLSLQSSPISKMFDAQDTQSGGSPVALTTAAFEMLVAQTPALLADGDISKQMLLHNYNQQRQDPRLDSSPTLSDASTTSNPFIEFLQDLRTPFTYFSSHSDPLISGSNSSPWPSLFPKSSETTPTADASPQRVEKTTQTEVFDEATLAATVSDIPEDIAATPSKFSTLKEEQDPEWLAFLDEASPLFSAETDVGDPLMTMDYAVSTEPHETPSSKLGTKQDEDGLWNWTESVFKPQTTVLRGHSGFVAGGAFGSMGSLGAGGMVRSLRGNYQQRSGYHTKSASSRTKELASPKPLENGRESVHRAKDIKQEDALKVSGGADVMAMKREVQSSSSPLQASKSSSAVTKDSAGVGETESFKGLVAMFRGLWKASTGERS
ncbi:hypothetical protein BGZ68_003118 [Mortierella alpina]|nr:hypothetical protein BGZ68_003118 [Mortierella alpina]